MADSGIVHDILHRGYASLSAVLLPTVKQAIKFSLNTVAAATRSCGLGGHINNTFIAKVSRDVGKFRFRKLTQYVWGEEVEQNLASVVDNCLRSLEPDDGRTIQLVEKCMDLIQKDLRLLANTTVKFGVPERLDACIGGLHPPSGPQIYTYILPLLLDSECCRIVRAAHTPSDQGTCSLQLLETSDASLIQKILQRSFTKTRKLPPMSLSVQKGDCALLSPIRFHEHVRKSLDKVLVDRLKSGKWPPDISTLWTSSTSSGVTLNIRYRRRIATGWLQNTYKQSLVRVYVLPAVYMTDTAAWFVHRSSPLWPEWCGDGSYCDYIEDLDGENSWLSFNYCEEMSLITINRDVFRECLQLLQTVYYSGHSPLSELKPLVFRTLCLRLLESGKMQRGNVEDQIRLILRELEECLQRRELCSYHTPAWNSLDCRSLDQRALNHRALNECVPETVLQYVLSLNSEGDSGYLSLLSILLE